MDNAVATIARVQARDAARKTLNRITTGVAVGGIVGVGVLAAVSAATNPGGSSTPPAPAAAETAATTAGSDDSTIPSTGLQPPATSVGSTSNPAVAVSGGSR